MTLAHTPSTIALLLSHPAPLTKEVAATLPIEERGWYLHTVDPATGGPAPVTKLPIPAWEPLVAHPVLVPCGHVFRLHAGPAKGPRSVRAGVDVDDQGRARPQVTAARLRIYAADRAQSLAARAAAIDVPYRSEVAGSRVSVKPGTVTMTGAAETVSDIALARVQGDEAHLRAHGIAVPPVVRVLGGRVNATGEANFGVSHKEWSEQPLTIDALEEVRTIVRAEARADVRVERKGLSMMSDGSLLAEGGALRLEATGLRGLVGLFGDQLPGATALLEVLPPAERAALFNRQLERSELSGPVRLRTRVVNGAPQVFAVVGEGYTPRDADALATDMIEALHRSPGGHEARGEVVYDATRATLTASALWHADHVVDLACGDVFRSGAELRGNDTGGGSIQVWSLNLRNLCYNLIILGKADGAVARVQHRGGHGHVIPAIQRGLRTALDISTRFVERWGYARKTSAIEALAAIRGARKVTLADGTQATLAEALGRAAGKGDEALARAAYGAILDFDHLDLPRRTDANVELLLGGWRHERGVTLADIANGVTRVHDAAIPVDTRVRFERAAGMLLA